MAEPIDIGSRRKVDDGNGELLFTVYYYERGHILHVPDEQLPPRRHEIWRAMFRSVWHEVGAVFEETRNPDDEILFLCAIATSGRVVTLTDNTLLDTLERHWWLQRMLLRIGEEDLPAFKCIYHNDNQERPSNEN